MSEVDQYTRSQAIIQPSAGQAYFDPSVEHTARQLLGS